MYEKTEWWYRDLLAAQTGGEAEARLPFGVADVLTETTVFEVEPATRYRTGVRQALQYGAQVPQKGAVAVYGDSVSLRTMFAAVAELHEPIDLWWYDGARFILIESAEHAASAVLVPEDERHWPPEPEPDPEPEEPGPAFMPGTVNERGEEIWWSTAGHPELDGLSPKEAAKMVAAHMPDPSPELWARLDELLPGKPALP